MTTALSPLPEKIEFVGGAFDGKQPHVGIADLYQVKDGTRCEYYELTTNCMAVCTPEAKERWSEAFGTSPT